MVFLQKMTKEQLSCEKMVLQKNLLHYEGLHGRPVSPSCCRAAAAAGCCCMTACFCDQVTREERLVVKPLYDRYRLVKQMLARVSISPVTVRAPPTADAHQRSAANARPPLQVSPSSKRRSQTLQPIIEGETAHFWEIKEEEEEEQKGGEEEEKEEREEEEDDEEEGESSGGEMQSSEVIMALEAVTPSGESVRSQPDGLSDKMEEGSGRLALDLRLSSSNASSM